MVSCYKIYRNRTRGKGKGKCKGKGNCKSKVVPLLNCDPHHEDVSIA